MSRRRILLGFAITGVLAGSVAPALADDGGSKVCLVATNDRTNPGPAPLCVWVPIERRDLQQR
jgi:hypothetical protein